MAWELGLLIAAGAALAGGCLVPNRWLPAALPNDKLMHFAAFAVLTGLALRVANGRAEALLWLAGLLLAGWLIECLQQLVPDRGFSWRDMAANAAGIASAALATLAWTLI
ncbi:VanZ family protein [Pseudoduganella sp. LjRoot289]|uniref:VanZ family protein n=1 Tax=Pseudoduganella sp. LjRoot289 TaxID=3342314 RepID=UPI003ECD82A9